MWFDWLDFCDYGFCVCPLMPLATPTILLGFRLPWAWGISSRLLQQSTAAAPYLGRGLSPHNHPSWPWTWHSSSWPSCVHAATALWRWCCSSWPELQDCCAKSLQSCLTLWDPIDGGPPGFPIPGILQARTLEWVAISFSNAWKWKVKVKSLSRVRLLVIPWTTAHQGLRPWDFPGKSTGVGCHFLLQLLFTIKIF